MFDSWSPEEIAEYQRNIALTDALQRGEWCGMSRSTIERWLKRRVDADAGNPRALLRGKSSGRPPVAAELSQAAVDRLRRQTAKCGSTALALDHFADDPLCPDDIRDKILTRKTPHSIPLSLRRACNVTPDLEAAHRGPVAYQHMTLKCRHNDQVADPVSGEIRKLQAGDIYISDDMSRNRYFWFKLSDPEIETRSGRGDKLARKYGVAIGRQGLYTMDASGKWLGFTLIGCARDAYTSADVLRHLHAVLADYGKPRIGWVLEQGVWKAKTVEGVPVLVPDTERRSVVGGIKSLGFGVEYVHTSEGKALIESGFNYLQSIHSLDDSAPDIGRRRGEMELPTKLISRVQQGVLHPAEAGLEHISEALQKDLKAAAFANGRPKFGRIQNGVPDECWIRDTNAHPLAKLEPKDAGVFMPTKLNTEIRQGCLEKKIGGTTFRFTLPDIFGVLGAGYHLHLAFDESNPAAGAEIYNLETGTRNTNNWGYMEWIGHGEWEKDRLLYGYSDEVGESTDRKKRYQRAFTQAYAGTGLFGRRNKTAIESRDGLGEVVRIERNNMPAVAASGRQAETGAEDSASADQFGLAGILCGSSRATTATSPGADQGTSFERKNVPAVKPARRILSRMELMHA